MHRLSPGQQVQGDVLGRVSATVSLGRRSEKTLTAQLATAAEINLGNLSLEAALPEALASSSIPRPFPLSSPSSISPSDTFSPSMSGLDIRDESGGEDDAAAAVAARVDLAAL